MIDCECQQNDQANRSAGIGTLHKSGWMFGMYAVSYSITFSQDEHRMSHSIRSATVFIVDGIEPDPTLLCKYYEPDYRVHRWSARANTTREYIIRWQVVVTVYNLLFGTRVFSSSFGVCKLIIISSSWSCVPHTWISFWLHNLHVRGSAAPSTWWLYISETLTWSSPRVQSIQM